VEAGYSNSPRRAEFPFCESIETTTIATFTEFNYLVQPGLVHDAAPLI